MNQPRRRSTELGLLVVALLVVTGAYVLTSLGRSSALPANIVPFLVAVLGLFLIAHLVNRRFAPHADASLLPIAALLNGLGYVLIARMSKGDSTVKNLATQQATWTAVGMLGYIGTLVFFRRVKSLERVRYTVGLVGVVLLILPMVPGVGVSINGARIWTRIGPIGFQPGELAKLALAIFFAGYLVQRRELLGLATFRIGPFVTPDPKYLAPVLAAWGFSLVVMIFEKDLGSALLFFVLFLSVLWVATERASYLVVGGVLFGAGSVATWASFAHVHQRVAMWLDPWTDPQGKGYQIIQAQYALAWGGVGGTGLGLGITGRIPYQETDFIFAIIGEELGLVGAAAILIAYLLIAGAGYRIAVRATDPFSKLLATGLTTLIAVQSFIIMGGVTRLLPLTGVTLSFVSYGGSSLISNWILIALLVRISDDTNSVATDARDDATTVLSLR